MDIIASLPGIGQSPQKAREPTLYLGYRGGRNVLIAFGALGSRPATTCRIAAPVLQDTCAFVNFLLRSIQQLMRAQVRQP